MQFQLNGIVEVRLGVQGCSVMEDYCIVVFLEALAADGGLECFSMVCMGPLSYLQ
jgi:hypothetical protein